MDMAVQTIVGMAEMVPVASPMTGNGATWATGAQAYKNESAIRKTSAMRFMGYPPDDKLYMVLTGALYGLFQ
jgi:hypothetical protein